jgi:hypothetical protein
MNPEITRLLMAERVREHRESASAWKRSHRLRRTWRLSLHHLPRLAWAAGTPASQVCTPSH